MIHVSIQSINVKLLVYAEKIAFSSCLADDIHVFCHGAGNHLELVRHGGLQTARR